MAEYFGKYKILNKIATGGMAEVFRAKITGEKGFEKLVVIKKVLPHLADEDKWIMHFTDEAKLAALLQHENIVHVYDSGKIGDTWYIAMEHLDGMDLKSVLTSGMKQDKPLSRGMILHIMKGICDGLDYAHSLKDYQGNHLRIIHRDISPQNIFLTFDGKVKIIDFGIAKAAERSVKTQTGTIKGKLAYMAPEHAEGKPIDHRSDIFSAGIIFYEMLTGTRMYQGEMAEILMKVVMAEFPPAAGLIFDCPPKILAVLDKALTRNPDDRYATAGEMAADIEDCLYTLDLRVGARHLAAHMKELFPEEQSKGVDALTTLDLTQSEERPPEKTTVMAPEPEKPPAKPKRERLPFKVTLPTDKIAHWFKAFKKAVQSRVVSRDELVKRLRGLVHTLTNNKAVAIAGVCIVLIAIAVTLKVSHNSKTQALITQYLETAQQRMEAMSYTTPWEDSAALYYQKVLEIDKDNEAAKQGIKDVVDKKIELAEMMLNRFRRQSAMAHINDGLKLDPANERLLELKNTAEKNVGERVFGGFKSLFKSNDDTVEAPDDTGAPESSDQ